MSPWKWILIFLPGMVHAETPSIPFVDRVIQLSRTEERGYRVAFELHAAIYRLPPGSPALKCLLASLQQKRKVLLEADPRRLEILRCSEKTAPALRRE
jgi:hypothetical protein